MPLRNERVYEVINKDYFPKRFQSILVGHRYGDTRQLLSSFMFLPAMRIKRTMLKVQSLKTNSLVDKRQTFSVVDDFKWSHF